MSNRLYMYQTKYANMTHLNLEDSLHVQKQQKANSADIDRRKLL